jgi:hypothetical protein
MGQQATSAAGSFGLVLTRCKHGLTVAYQIRSHGAILNPRSKPKSPVTIRFDNGRRRIKHAGMDKGSTTDFHGTSSARSLKRRRSDVSCD